jgi:hypothetical protein
VHCLMRMLTVARSRAANSVVVPWRTQSWVWRATYWERGGEWARFRRFPGLGAPAAAPALCGESHGFAGELVRERLNDSQGLAWEGSYDRDDSCCVGLVIVKENGQEAQAAVRV